MKIINKIQAFIDNKVITAAHGSLKANITVLAKLVHWEDYPLEYKVAALKRIKQLVDKHPQLLAEDKQTSKALEQASIHVARLKNANKPLDQVYAEMGVTNKKKNKKKKNKRARQRAAKKSVSTDKPVVDVNAVRSDIARSFGVFAQQAQPATAKTFVHVPIPDTETSARDVVSDSEVMTRSKFS